MHERVTDASEWFRGLGYLFKWDRCNLLEDEVEYIDIILKITFVAIFALLSLFPDILMTFVTFDASSNFR